MYTLSIVLVVSGIALMAFGAYQAYTTSNALYQCAIAPNSVCTLTYPQVLNSQTVLYTYSAVFSVGMVVLLAGVVFYVGSRIVVDK
jgi:hypothetical protein